MDIRYIDIEISMKKNTGEEDEQNLYKTLFSRRFRISANFPMAMDEDSFRQFLHTRVDIILSELKHYMEAM